MIIYIITAIILYLFLAHFTSYHVLKNQALKSQKWDLNICCGKTNGKGINADIYKHKNVPNFILIKDIYNLPFKDKQFDNVLCSHTIEHIEYPEKFYKELKRVGNKITILIPPLWDIGAVLHLLKHKWIFLTFKTTHNKLPKYIKLPLSSFFQNHFKQNIKP